MGTDSKAPARQRRRRPIAADVPPFAASRYTPPPRLPDSWREPPTLRWPGRLRDLVHRLTIVASVFVLFGVAAFGAAAAYTWQQVQVPDEFAAASPVATSGSASLPVDLRLVPPLLRHGAPAAGDVRFRDHVGIDLRAMVDEVADSAARGGDISIPPSITQRYVASIRPVAAAGVRQRFERLVMVAKVEQELSKDQILARHLNTADFGRDARGVATAARVYFGKSVGELGAAEIAYLLTVLHDPGLGELPADSTTVVDARNVTLSRLSAANLLDEAQVADVMARPISQYLLPADAEGVVSPS